MPDLVPVAVSNTMPQESVGTTGRSEVASFTSERKLSEYVAEIQAQSLAAGKAGLLANPAALGGEAMKLLKGYFDRLNKTENLTSKKVNFMSEDKGQGADAAAKDNGSPVHGGPARQHFEPTAQTASGGAVDGIQPMAEPELSRTAEMLLQSLRLASEGSLIASAASGFQRSTNTLLRGT